MKIKKVTNDDDFDLVLALDLQIFGKAEGGYTSLAELKNCDAWLIADGSLYVGYAVLKTTGTIAKLDRVGLHDCARGKGFQRKLIRLREQRAKELGYSEVVTYVSSYNIISLNNLIKAGYRAYEPPVRSAAEHFVYLKKELK
jgi:GNAT superfamily N-acetyltransferase